MVRRSEGLSSRPEDPNTLTWQSASTKYPPRDPLCGTVTGVMTQASYMNKRIACVPSFYNVPEVWAFAPYQIKVLNILSHFRRTFLNFDTTTIQSSYDVIMTLLRYLNNNTDTSGPIIHLLLQILKCILLNSIHAMRLSIKNYLSITQHTSKKVILKNKIYHLTIYRCKSTWIQNPKIYIPIKFPW